jgi:hypothetical protein
MLYQGNRIHILLISFILLSVGCNRSKQYNEKELKNIRNNSINMSFFVIEEDEYWGIYNKMNDSVNSWINNKLRNYAYWNSIINFQVDSVLCINREKNKIITTILLPYVGENGRIDDVEYFYGVKIKKQWYFFSGPTLSLPREWYQADIHTPLSFEKMKELAAKHIYRGYLKKNPLWKEQSEVEEYVINERFFADFTSVAWCTDCVTQDQWDEAYLKWVNGNWKKRDTTHWEEWKEDE